MNHIMMACEHMFSLIDVCIKRNHSASVCQLEMVNVLLIMLGDVVNGSVAMTASSVYVRYESFERERERERELTETRKKETDRGREGWRLHTPTEPDRQTPAYANH